MQGVGETIKEVEQADHRRNLYDFAVIKMGLHFVPKRFVYLLRACRHNLRVAQSYQFALSEQVAMGIDMIHRIQQFLADS